MTKQEIFDRVWTHFVTNGAPLSIARDDFGRRVCRYRGNGGAACAVGLFIPDDEYVAQMEGLDVHGILGHSLSPTVQRIVDELGDALLADLQIAHDDETGDIRGGLQRVARSHGLRIPEATR